MTYSPEDRRERPPSIRQHTPIRRFASQNSVKAEKRNADDHMGESYSLPADWVRWWNGSPIGRVFGGRRVEVEGVVDERVV
jgi:hypothetical protein